MNLIGFIAFIFWVAILIVASYFIDRFLVQLISPRLYRIIITPGIIIHELSHALACVLMRAKINRIRFFAPSGGAVEHQPPRMPLIGKPIISLAPLIGVTLAIFGLAYYMGYRAAMPQIDFSSSFLLNFNTLFKGAFKIISLSFGDWQFWAFLYLLLSLSASIAPSITDLKNAAFSTIFIAIIVGLLIRFNIGTALTAHVISNYLGWIIALGAMFEILALVIIIPIYMVKRIITR